MPHSPQHVDVCHSRRPWGWALRAFLVGCLASTLAGCETAAKVVQVATQTKEKALEFTGLKLPESEKPEAALPLRRIPLRVQASESLNINAEGQSLALVLRIYKLRHADAFLSAPYQTFSDPTAYKERLGDDVLEMRELQLVPGQVVDTLEKAKPEAAYLGVVALYLRPSPQRWKLVFDANAAQLTGISIAAHACALSVVKGEPQGPAAGVLRSGLGACPEPDG